MSCRDTVMQDLSAKKIYCEDLDPVTTGDSLRRYFEQFGAVTKTSRWTRKRDHGRKVRWEGLVVFEDEFVAQLVVGNHEIDGKMIEVRLSSDKKFASLGEQKVGAE